MSSVLEPIIEPAIEPAEPYGPTNPNPLKIQSNPTYRYDPNRKTSSGSYLRIQKDGTVTYNNPNCLKSAGPGSKPFKMPALNPRNDGSAKTFERLKASIEKRASKVPNGRFQEYVGRPCLTNWRIVCTDGKTMLLDRGEAKGERSNVFDRFEENSCLVCSIDNPEFHLALKRSKIMAPPENHLIRLTGSTDGLVVASSHEEPRGQRGNNDAGDFEETLDVKSSEPWQAAFNQTYIEPVCGVWPLNVWWKSEEHQMVFEPVGGEWRYIVMPIRYEFETNGPDQK